MRLRRKGLALLYYLALEGPTRRERLADLLWGHGRALQNLRVELHRLKDSLAPLGLAPFADGSDPLSLAGIRLEPNTVTGTVMDGLDDVSPEYQEWLERQRSRDAHGGVRNTRASLVEELARTIDAPYVLVLAGEPGSGRRLVAKELATRLTLPFIEGCGRSGPALHYVVAGDTSCGDVAATIEADDQSVWVLQRSLFGEDEEVVVRLRAAIAPERIRFVTLEPLPWWSAKGALPEDMKFVEGARLFVASAGNQRYLKELLKLRAMVEPGASLPVPLSVRAAFALEARKLSDGARHALERTSIHHGTLSRELLQAVGAIVHLEELERNGWLTFRGTGWRFASELSRRMIEGQLREGTRRRLHGEVAEALERQGSAPGASYHRSRSVGTPQRAGSSVASDYGDSAPVVTHVGVGRELWLDDATTEGAPVHVSGDRVTFSRTDAGSITSHVSFAVDNEVLLLRVKGRAYVEHDPVATEAAPPTLVLSLSDSVARAVHFGAGQEARIDSSGRLCLPLGERFTYWLLAPAGRELHLSSSCAGAVIELKVNAYRPLATNADGIATGTIVEAYALDGFSHNHGDVVDSSDAERDGKRFVDNAQVWT